jgi:mannonate dehydratase
MIPVTSRRSILQYPLTAALAGRAAQAAKQLRRSIVDEYDPDNVKLGHRVPADITDEDLLFLKQLGLRWARVEFGRRPVSLEFLRETQDRFARFGIKIHSAVQNAYQSLKVQLGQPGRDEDIEIYQEFLRNLGRLGIPVAPYDFHPANTYTTAVVNSARGYRAREFDESEFRKKVEKQRFERPYNAEEIWSAYTYFVKAVLPVAEQANVTLALHPDDPPLALMNRVAKLFVNIDGYRRAEKIAGGSKCWGIVFCVGTWAEGGPRMGKTVLEMIHEFGSRGKIHEVHFRNVSSPLPRFLECFPDDGYVDMYQVMKALRKVCFRGLAIPDHVPALAGDRGIRRAGTAYCIACMRAYLCRANQEIT